VTHKLKGRVVQELRNILLLSGKKIISADDFVAIADETIAKVGSQETGTACD
jgi:hypothetical protein